MGLPLLGLHLVQAHACMLVNMTHQFLPYKIAVKLVHVLNQKNYYYTILTSMWKKVALALLYIAAVDWFLLSSASSPESGYGYSVSYPGDECLKCNCSLKYTTIATIEVTSDKTYRFMTMFMNKSDCAGQGSMNHDCYCYGNPDYLIGQTDRDNNFQFNGTMGDLNCFGTLYSSIVITLTCRGQKRSETMIIKYD